MYVNTILNIVCVTCFVRWGDGVFSHVVRVVHAEAGDTIAIRTIGVQLASRRAVRSDIAFAFTVRIVQQSPQPVGDVRARFLNEW